MSANVRKKIVVLGSLLSFSVVVFAMQHNKNNEVFLDRNSLFDVNYSDGVKKISKNHSITPNFLRRKFNDHFRHQAAEPNYAAYYSRDCGGKSHRYSGFDLKDSQTEMNVFDQKNFDPQT